MTGPGVYQVPDRGRLRPEQISQLLEPIRPKRVYQNQGHSNVAAWDIAAHLTRMFGFGGWEKEILELSLISQSTGTDLGIQGKSGWYVTYRCQIRLRIYNPEGILVCQLDDVATGSAQNQPTLGDAHDFACKNAVSYALKRCAKDLGDQFGLSLYNKGQKAAVVRKTLVGSPTATEDEPDHEVEGEGSDQPYEDGYG